jgi:hypothetical protein
MATRDKWIRVGTRVLFVLVSCCAVAGTGILIAVRHLPTPADISIALSYNPEAYTLSLGHMEDLTLRSFAYLRLPLALAVVAFLIGAIGNLWWKGQRAFLASAVMMVVFFHAARLAMVAFDPFLSTKPLADVILRSPPGKSISAYPYYEFSSVWFYANRDPLIWNGRYNNLEYGSYAPGAPDIFIDDARMRSLWLASDRYYLVAEDDQLPRISTVLAEQLNPVAHSGGKIVLTNHPLPDKVSLSVPK